MPTKNSSEVYRVSIEVSNNNVNSFHDIDSPDVVSPGVFNACMCNKNFFIEKVSLVVNEWLISAVMKKVMGNSLTVQCSIKTRSFTLFLQEKIIIKTFNYILLHSISFFILG